MRLHRVVLSAFVLALAGLIAVVANTSVTTAQTEPGPKVIEIKAKKYDFTPNKIEVPLHSTVRFSITAEDHDHGFEIEGVKDSCVKIEQGKTKTVDFKAEKAGEYKFKCCNFCGMGHGGMKGTFTVK